MMYPTTTINDLPDVILSTILSLITSPRSRNSSSLVSHKWCALERYTRSSLTLRGNLPNLFMMPDCFPSISHLDLSLLSPWGHPLATSPDNNNLIAHLLRQYFPTIISLTFYARNKETIHLLLSQWEKVENVKLVRWHQRPQNVAPGDELKGVFQNCGELRILDLSSFYCWTEDLLPGLEAFPNIASKLITLNLLNKSFPEGFKSEEIKAITKCCPGLKEFKAACIFDPRYIGFLGNEGLVCVSRNCPNLRILHLADTKALGDVRGDVEDDGFTEEDARVCVGRLIELFSGLPDLEDLVLDVCNNVRDSGPALEILHSKCRKLRSVRLGRFHGISMPVESRLDGVAVCQRLEALSIGNVGDLTDMGLIGIGRGCNRLRKFEIYGCKMVTVRGMRTLASLLHKTLVDVKISCCKNLGAASSLKALEPLQSQIERLHIECVWESPEVVKSLDGIGSGFDLNSSDQSEVSCNNSSYEYDEMSNASKRCKYSYDLNSCAIGFDLNGDGYDNGSGLSYVEKPWERLKHLSLWIAVGELLTPLQSSGLENCPNLEEIQIKVEGDCRTLSKPSKREFGLSVLVAYPRLSKMQLDCGEVIGFAHTAPSGQMDLSLWERFYLFGIGHLNLKELDYWLPQDRDVNQRSLSLPAAGLLRECVAIRKLFIHGTTHEHFMMFFLGIPGLRDCQWREDYYPAPEDDMSTEMRADACRRFETALNRRWISD